MSEPVPRQQLVPAVVPRCCLTLTSCPIAAKTGSRLSVMARCAEDPYPDGCGKYRFQWR